MDRSLRHAKTKLVDDGNRSEATGQQRNDRPEVNYTRRPDKTCIWIEYREHQLSTLLDTGSDVSIAGEKLARGLGWTIRAHSTEAVSVANNKTMTIRGAVRVALIVAGRSVESEILIAPDFDGLLLVSTGFAVKVVLGGTLTVDELNSANKNGSNFEKRPSSRLGPA